MLSDKLFCLLLSRRLDSVKKQKETAVPITKGSLVEIFICHCTYKMLLLFESCNITQKTTGKFLYINDKDT